ncbi:MAG: ATP-binding protein [Oscillospiraceae bacterium]|nr:ATP-binding protein [Oscillospiraceae bacterium]
MKKRIFRSMCLLSAVVILLTATLVSILIYNDSYQTMKMEVRLEADYLRAGLESGGRRFLNKLDRDTLKENQSRVTLIDETGNVSFDSETTDPLDNHLDRPEVQAAFANGEGEDSRMSRTFATQTYYYAVKLENGQVLRVSSTMDSVYMVWVSAIPTMLAIAAIVFGLSLVLAIRQTKRIVRPINQLNLEAPVENVIYDELSPLLTRIEKQNQLIRRQMEDIQTRQADFEAITSNMREGMVIVDLEGKILSYNESATRILDVESIDGTNRSYLVFNRTEEFQEAVNAALQGESTDRILEIDQRQYQLLGNPVRSEQKIRGAVLLLLDVTERQEREQLRREFSANVSHELKTPLNVVSGYAELMKNGLVKPEDVPQFADNIYQEAQRLITLVEDIIKVSRLDENTGDLPKERTDLHDLAELAVDCLSSTAEKRQITLALHGGAAVVEGVPQILSEMVFNLCDNAVKYNRDGGRVDIATGVRDKHPFLTVADTGIGIPEGQLDRIFERFYRVDKSHSRKIGGTGLGLSIVKHGASYHGAEVSVHSTEGVGTTVTVTFPIA